MTSLFLLLIGCASNPGDDDTVLKTPDGAELYAGFGEQYCEMEELGRVTLPGDYKTGITVRGNYAYVTCGWAGLQVVNIASPTNPTVVGSYNQFYYWDAHRMMLVGDVLAVAHLWAGWYLMDVSDPTNPTELSRTLVEHTDPTVSWGFPATDVWMDDQYAYVAGTHLVIYDITDPSAPQVVGEVPPEWDTSVPDAERLHTTTTVRVDGNYAYLTEADDLYGRIVVVDVSDKTNPHVVAWIDGPGDVYQLDLVGDVAYAADLEFGIRTVDISNPLDPQLLDTYRTSGQSYSLHADGDRVYVADNLNGLMGIDVSDPTDLQWASFHHVGGKPGRVGLEIGDGDGPWGVSAANGVVAMITSDDLVLLRDCDPE